MAVSEEAVQKVAHKLSGATGIGGTDSLKLKTALLMFGKQGGASRVLREAVANFNLFNLPVHGICPIVLWVGDIRIVRFLGVYTIGPSLD
jgi:hypothetical protein